VDFKPECDADIDYYMDVKHVGAHVIHIICEGMRSGKFDSYENAMKDILKDIRSEVEPIFKRD